MKRLLLVATASALTLTGCFSGGLLGGHKDQVGQANKAPPQVYAEQVNESNAHQMAQAMGEEIDFDAQHAPKQATH
jgi:hypothetical protein